MQWLVIVLGLGLGMVAAAGADRSVGWLATFDFVAAIAAMLIGVVAAARPSIRRAASLLGVLVIAISLLGYLGGTESWMVWWGVVLGAGLVLDAVLADRRAFAGPIAPAAFGSRLRTRRGR